jgi:hypothetical protein
MSPIGEEAAPRQGPPPKIAPDDNQTDQFTLFSIRPAAVIAVLPADLRRVA